MVSDNRISVDPSKIESAVNWERLTSVTEIRSILRLAGYYRRFIKEFSQQDIPLSRLTKKDTPFVWIPYCESSFQELKERLTSAPMLVLPNPDVVFEVYCVASGQRLGYVSM
ncbi:uncharacterized mitochondrial protein AtMg00860-like [Arachis stenosperma]|uniref:uncharacterized mitochondrial protein AtMg00860-like n=1 Tax=Arachis stenosperma TaxID=217475 RepID=UPI0025AC4F30|nr:uncharacterized mitochondrial protein AtMg00860-like [Arachis stenosperma]